MKTSFSFSKSLRYRIEGWLIKIFLGIYGALPFPLAVRLGKWMGQTFGPYSEASKVCKRNLRMIFPKASEEALRNLEREVWGNLGKIPAEYVHIKTFFKRKERGRIRVEGIEILERVRDDGKPAILFTGHLGSWQMVSVASRLNGLELVQLYRPANNPWAEKIMRSFQAQVTRAVITKGSKGARSMISALQKGEHLFVLADQKLNEGILVPFLGHPAMTAPAIARLAQKFKCPLIPVRTQRVPGLSFQVTFYPPLSLEGSEYDVMERVNHLLGEWILERPEQWFWVHSRWSPPPSK